MTTSCVIMSVTGVFPISIRVFLVFSRFTFSVIENSIASSGNGRQRSSFDSEVSRSEITSVSVTMPMTLSPSMTGRPPIRYFLSSLATSLTCASKATVTGFGVMTSFISILSPETFTGLRAQL